MILRKLLCHSGYNFNAAVGEMAASIDDGWLVHEVIRVDDRLMNCPRYEIVLIRKENMQ